MPNRKIEHIIAKAVGSETEETLDVYDSEALHPSDVIDNLTPTSTTLPLSANMGKALKDSMPIRGIQITANSTITQNGIYTKRGQFLLVVCHTTNTSLRGIYCCLSSTVIVPIVDATGLNVSITGDVLTIINDTSGNAYGIIL